MAASLAGTPEGSGAPDASSLGHQKAAVDGCLAEDTSVAAGHATSEDDR